MLYSKNNIGQTSSRSERTPPLLEATVLGCDLVCQPHWFSGCPDIWLTTLLEATILGCDGSCNVSSSLDHKVPSYLAKHYLQVHL